MLVGEGVSLFAQKRGMNLVDNSSLVSGSAKKMYEKINKRIEEFKMEVEQKDASSENMSVIPGGFILNGVQFNVQDEQEGSQVHQLIIHFYGNLHIP